MHLYLSVRKEASIIGYQPVTRITLDWFFDYKHCRFLSDIPQIPLIAQKLDLLFTYSLLISQANFLYKKTVDAFQMRG